VTPSSANNTTVLEQRLAEVERLLAKRNQEIELLQIRNSYLETRERQRTEPKGGGGTSNFQNLYFVRADSSIKIGVATNTKKRKHSLQTANHRPLQTILTMENAGEYESRFHELTLPWQELGTGSEWRNFGPLVDAFIKKITTRPYQIDELLKVVEEFVAEHKPDHLVSLKEAKQKKEKERIQRHKDSRIIPFSVAKGKVPKESYWSVRSEIYGRELELQPPIRDEEDVISLPSDVPEEVITKRPLPILERDSRGRFVKS